jgi:hypothetical protein
MSEADDGVLPVYPIVGPDDWDEEYEAWLDEVDWDEDENDDPGQDGAM